MGNAAHLEYIMNEQPQPQPYQQPQLPPQPYQQQPVGQFPGQMGPTPGQLEWAQLQQTRPHFEGVSLATPGMRVKANFIQGFVGGALTALIQIVMFGAFLSGPEGYIIVLGCFIAYTALAIGMFYTPGWNGHYIGSSTTQMRMVNIDTGRVPGWKYLGRQIIRSLAATCTLAISEYFHYKSMEDGRARSWLDKMSGIAVVQVNTVEWYANGQALNNHSQYSPFTTPNTGTYPHTAPNAATPQAANPMSNQPPTGFTSQANNNFTAPQAITPAAQPAQTTQAVTLSLSTGLDCRVESCALVGRDPLPHKDYPDAALIQLGDETGSVSATHFACGVDSTGFWVVDLGSTNGLRLRQADGTWRPLPAGQRIVVALNSVVQCGNHSWLVKAAL